MRPHARRPDVRLIRALARISRSAQTLGSRAGSRPVRGSADDIEVRPMPASFSADLPTKPPCGLSLGWSGAVRPMPATASPTFFPGVCHAFLARQEARLSPSSAVLRPSGCKPAVHRLSTAIETASGGFEEQSGETKMAQIGTFNHGEDGSYTGTKRPICTPQ